MPTGSLSGVEAEGDGPCPHQRNLNVFDTLGIGDPIIVHGLHGTETSLDKESGDILARSVVVVDNHFGEVGVSLQ